MGGVRKIGGLGWLCGNRSKDFEAMQNRTGVYIVGLQFMATDSAVRRMLNLTQIADYLWIWVTLLWAQMAT